MNDLYETLEICLNDIEQGADVDTVLFRYPELADELRPILEASRNASSLAVQAPSADVVRRNRARVLQHAAQMREAKARVSSRRFWLVAFRRVAVTFVVVALLFASGTGLVRAASTTVPGDQLYPVKRTWEDVRVLLTFNLQQRDALEVEHENERIQELQELLAEKRSEEVEFVGLIKSQNGTDWVVGSIRVVVTDQTQIEAAAITLGSPVRVKGQTQSNGAVVAEKVEVLPPGAKLPDVDEEHELEEQDYEDQGLQIQNPTSTPQPAEWPKLQITESPDSGTGQLDPSSNDGSDSGDHNGGGEDNGGDGQHDSGGDHPDSSTGDQ